MREILFRGKRKDTGEWIYGSVVYFWEEVYIIPAYTNTFRRIEVIPETVGQYVNLSDTNAQAIYEGDVIKSSWGYKGVVELDEIIYAKLECLFNEDCEVIGNVHDNPELLEVNNGSCN